MYLLQLWFSLSDVQTEFQCQDRMSFRRFLGVSFNSPIPDSTTLEDFRRDMRNADLDTRFLNDLDDFFKDAGLLLKQGSLVDATFMKANARPRKAPQDSSDPDADHGHKGYGYSATINVDKGSKLIRTVHTTSERPHDSQGLAPVLIGDEGRVVADSGYTGMGEVAKAKGVKLNHLKRRPRGKKGKPTPELALRDKYMNRVWSAIRGSVEHVFACWKTVFKVDRVWYRGLEAVKQQMNGLALAYNLRRYGYLARG
jgi:IS5 family transposase